jgi:hypothetical protein
VAKAKDGVVAGGVAEAHRGMEIASLCCRQNEQGRLRKTQPSTRIKGKGGSQRLQTGETRLDAKSMTGAPNPDNFGLARTIFARSSFMGTNRSAAQ